MLHFNHRGSKRLNGAQFVQNKKPSPFNVHGPSQGTQPRQIVDNKTLYGSHNVNFWRGLLHTAITESGDSPLLSQMIAFIKQSKPIHIALGTDNERFDSAFAFEHQAELDVLTGMMHLHEDGEEDAHPISFADKGRFRVLTNQEAAHQQELQQASNEVYNRIRGTFSPSVQQEMDVHPDILNEDIRRTKRPDILLRVVNEKYRDRVNGSKTVAQELARQAIVSMTIDNSVPLPEWMVTFTTQMEGAAQTLPLDEHATFLLRKQDWARKFIRTLAKNKTRFPKINEVVEGHDSSDVGDTASYNQYTANMTVAYEWAERFDNVKRVHQETTLTIEATNQQSNCKYCSKPQATHPSTRQKNGGMATSTLPEHDGSAYILDQAGKVQGGCPVLRKALNHTQGEKFRDMTAYPKYAKKPSASLHHPDVVTEIIKLGK